MTKLGDVYTDFSLIDVDTRGGYARVARAQHRSPDDKIPKDVAFKIMGVDNWESGMMRFSDEIDVLSNILGNRQEMPASVKDTITQLYGFGYIQKQSLTELEKDLDIDLNKPLIELDSLIDFRKEGESLEKNSPGKWRPYLVLELANYDDSLLRQINRMPSADDGLYRIPTGEIIIMALKLLDTISYMHKKGRAYIDWKPEHIHWNGLFRSVKLIDWNVTCPIDSKPGVTQNIIDDTRLFCGAVLYHSLTMVDIEGRQPGADPTKKKFINNPLSQARLRYTPHHDVIFYRANKYLDDQIRSIVRKGLDVDEGFESPLALKETLLEYASRQLGIAIDPLDYTFTSNAYTDTLAYLRDAQKTLYLAYNSIVKTIGEQGNDKEFDRLRQVIIKTQDNFPIP